MQYSVIQEKLPRDPHVWLVTGCAGFIGSHLVERLLGLGQRVAGLDNFSTGHRHNLEDVRARAGREAWSRFTFVEGDIRDPGVCHRACRGVDYVLHQAALGSVPRSLADPLATHASNVDGFLHLLLAAREAGVRRFVYASSSSVYGDHPTLPKREDATGRALSPYAASKQVDELYAGVFERAFGLPTVGLRYFNVFGPRQDPAGPYAAVIPKWVASLLAGEACTICGDGETSRDFCYVENAVQANLLGAVQEGEGVTDEVYNVAVGERTTLKDLFRIIRDDLAGYRPEVARAEPRYGPFRDGDVRHSQAEIAKARLRLGYEPTHTVRQGMHETLGWYVRRASVSIPIRHLRPVSGSLEPQPQS